jgi:hypothetical protein
MCRSGHCGQDRWRWSILSEKREGGSGWVGGGGHCGWASQCIAECLIGKSIEIESTCGLKPALEIVVLWSICARLRDFVLSGGLKTSAKL